MVCLLLVGLKWPSRDFAFRIKKSVTKGLKIVSLIHILQNFAYNHFQEFYEGLQKIRWIERKIFLTELNKARRFKLNMILTIQMNRVRNVSFLWLSRLLNFNAVIIFVPHT
jgi:hypothetical protein